MAIVPEYGGPQVSPTVGAGTQGAQFQAMAAPKANVLAPMEKAMDKIGRMQAQLLEEQDDAIATDIDTKYAQYCQQLLNDPKTGFMARKGINALQPDKDGVSPVDAMMQKAGVYLQELMDGRTKNQIARVKAKTDSRTTGLYASGMQHAMAENISYNVSVYRANLQSEQDAGLADFNQPEKLAEHVARVERSAGILSKYTGEDSRAKTREAVAGVYKNAALGFLFGANNDPSLYGQGLAFVQKNAKSMLPQDVFALSTQFNTGMKNYEAVISAQEGIAALTPPDAPTDQVMAAIRGNGVGAKALAGSEHYVMSQGIRGNQLEDKNGVVSIVETKKGGETAYGSDGVTRSMAEAVAGKKLTDEEWRAIYTNKDESQRVGLSYLGALGTKYGETEKAVAAYVGTQKEVDDAVAKAKKEGGVWTQYLSKETAEAAATALRRLDGAFDAPVKGADGSALSFLDNRYAARAYQGVSEEAMRAYARQHPMSINPDFEDRMVAYMKRYESERMNAYTTEHQNAVNTACSEYEQNGQISAQTLMRLTTKERVAVRKYCQELDAGGFTTSTHYAAYLDTHLDELGNFTKDELDNAMRLVPKASQRRFRKEWERRHGQTQEQLEARYAAQNGLVTLGKTGVHVGMTMKAMRDFLPGFKNLPMEQQAISAEGVMNLAGMAAAIEGVDLKDANKAQQFVIDTIINNVYTDSQWWGLTSDRKSIFEFKYGDLDSEVKGIADELAKLSGNDRKMTPGARMGNLISFMLLKNVNFSTGDLARRPRIRNMVYQMIDQDMQRDPKYAGMSPAQRRALIEPAMKNDSAVVRQFLFRKLTEGV